MRPDYTTLAERVCVKGVIGNEYEKLASRPATYREVGRL